MMLSARRAVDLRRGDADAAARPAREGLEARELGREGAFADSRAARIGDDLRRMVLAGADDQVEDAVTVDIAHGDADAALEAGERD